MATFAGPRTEEGLEHSQSITDTVGLTECQGGGGLGTWDHAIHSRLSSVVL